MPLTAEQYRESLRQYHPTVYLNGRRVESVPDEPAFQPGINALGLTYDYALRDDLAPLMIAVQHTSGKTDGECPAILACPPQGDLYRCSVFRTCSGSFSRSFNNTLAGPVG